MQDKIKNIGLFEPGIYIGAVEADGTPPALSSMSFIGDIVPDSLNREDDEDTFEVLKSQETGDPWAELLTEDGTKKFVFSTYNFKTDNLIKAMGGSVDANGSWLAPVTTFRGLFYAMAYVSKADADKGFHFAMNFPKVKLKGNQEGVQSETDSNKLMFQATLFQPENASGVKQPDRRFDLIPAAPLFTLQDNTGDAITWDYVGKFILATEYEISEDGGGESGTWADCTANPQSVTPPGAIGDIAIRVKAVIAGDTKNRAGFETLNTVEFTV